MQKKNKTLLKYKLPTLYYISIIYYFYLYTFFNIILCGTTPPFRRFLISLISRCLILFRFLRDIIQGVDVIFNALLLFKKQLTIE